MTKYRNILDIQVSYQENTWSNISRDISIETVLNQIKSDTYKNQVEELRNKLSEGDDDYYNNYKKKLPSVTFSATFNIKRTNTNLIAYNPIIVIDIDKLNSIQLQETYNSLIYDEYVFAFWRSPSNNGYKGLVIIDYKLENSNPSTFHKSAFKKVAEYFEKTYNIILDKSGSDITRLCFLSHDTNLIQKTNFKEFEIMEEDILALTKSKSNTNNAIPKYTNSRDTLYNPLNKNNPSDRKIMTDIIRHLKNRRLSITLSYDNWCKVAMAISNTFTFDVGLNYFLKLSSLDINKYNQNDCTNFLTNCYETQKGSITFGSIVYLANQQGFSTKKQKVGVAKEEE